MILPVGTPPAVPPESLQLTFAYKASTVLEPIPIKLPKPDAKGAITLNANDLNKLAKQIVTRITDDNLVITPNAVIVTSSILLQPPPDKDQKVVPGYSTSNQLAVAFEFVIQKAAKPASATPASAAPATSKQATANAAIGTSSAAALDASALWPKGYSRGIVPAQDVATAKDDSQKAHFPFTSISFDPAARKTSADSDEFRSFPLLFDPDQESGSVIRTQAQAGLRQVPQVGNLLSTLATRGDTHTSRHQPDRDRPEPNHAGRS